MAQPHAMIDVLVVLPGIMGSTLYRDGHPVWEPSAGAAVAALGDRFRSVSSMRLPDGVGDEHPEDGVTAVRLMPDVSLPLGLWTFNLGYTALMRFLASSFEVNTDETLGPRNLVTFPYDWRLSNRYNGAQLARMVEPVLERWRAQGGAYADAGLVFICHSMGGLVARWYLDRLGGAEHTKALITVATPHRGAMNALDQLVNGVRRGVGPFKTNLTAFGRSLPSVHQLAPEYACVDDDGHLRKTTEITLPEVDTTMIIDAMAFHVQLDLGRLATAASYKLYPIGGYKQPTLTTGRISGNHLDVFREIEGDDLRGDATVPRLSIAPPDVAPDSPTLHHAADNHSGLIHNQSVFDQIEAILTARTKRHRAPLNELSVDIPETLDPGEALIVKASVSDDDAPLGVFVADDRGQPVGYPQRLLPRADGDVLETTVALPGPGVYRVTVKGSGPGGAAVAPISTIVLSWPTETQLDLEQP